MPKSKNPKYVKPTSDIGFHWIFCKEGNEELVLQLLNACIDDKEIVSFKRLSGEHSTNIETNFRFDLYCECGDGSRIVVECQNYAKRENFAKRALAYSAMAISDQLKPKMNFEYNKVYFIGLLNYNQFKKSIGPITKVRLFTEDIYELADDNYLQIYVELRKLPNDMDVDFPTLFLKAIRDIGKGEKEESLYSNDKRLETLFKAARFGSMPKEQQDKYKEDMTYESDYREYWEEQVSDAKNEGIAEGKAKRELEIATAMKADNMPTDYIVKYTGLTAKEIEEL